MAYKTGKEKFLHLRKSFQSQEADVLERKAKAQEHTETYIADLRKAREKYLDRKPPEVVEEEKKATTKRRTQKAKLPARRTKTTSVE